MCVCVNTRSARWTEGSPSGRGRWGPSTPPPRTERSSPRTEHLLSTSSAIAGLTQLAGAGLEQSAAHIHRSDEAGCLQIHHSLLAPSPSLSCHRLRSFASLSSRARPRRTWHTYHKIYARRLHPHCQRFTRASTN